MIAFSGAPGFLVVFAKQPYTLSQECRQIKGCLHIQVCWLSTKKLYLLLLTLGAMTPIQPSFPSAAILFPSSHLTLLDVFPEPHLPALSFAAYVAVPFSVFLSGWDTNWCRAHLFPAELTFCIYRCQSQASNKVQNNNQGECVTITELGLARAAACIWFCNGFSDFFLHFLSIKAHQLFVIFVLGTG